MEDKQNLIGSLAHWVAAGKLEAKLVAPAIRILADDGREPQSLAALLEAFEDARMKFDVRYYLVAILFILFDLEVAFLFPWGATLGDLGPWSPGFWGMMLFLAILTVGFVYEWKKGALDWE